MAEDPDTEEEAVDEEEAEEEEEYNPLDDPEWLANEYYSEEEGGEGEARTQESIGDEVGVTSSTVSHYMRKHGLETRANVVTDDRLDDPEWLANAYLSEEEGGEGEEMTMQDIADEVGCSDGTVMRRLHEHDIPVRRSTIGQSSDEDDEDAGAEEPEDEAEEPEGESGDDEEA